MNPSLAHFQLLRRLRQQLRHHNGMGVVYLFSDHELANQWLVQELDAHLRARSQRLNVLRASAPSEPVSSILSPVFSPVEGGQGAAGPVFWLALTEPVPAPEWDALRAQVLARLNENRAALSKNHAFIFLVFPAAFEGRAPTIAPDLWSVRSASHHVPAWLANAEPGQIRPELTAPALASQANASATEDAANPEELRWQSQWQVWKTDRRQVLSPVWAWQLVEQWLERGRPQRAKQFAEQALAITRRATDLTQDAPQSLRDLSISLNKVGDVARDLGQLEEARSAYRESLEIRRRLATLTQDAPQSLRDLSVSLDKVGDVARDLGQLEEARSAYRESLEISRRLATLTQDAPPSLRDLSVSLNKVGEVARDLGQLEEARSAYRDSLEIRRRLATLTQDAPQSLRDLSVSLNKVGDVARDLGQLEEARSCFAEALSLVKRLRQVLASDNTLAGFEADLVAKLEQAV